MAYNRIDRHLGGGAPRAGQAHTRGFARPALLGHVFDNARRRDARFRYCKVYVSVLEPEKRKGVMDALKSAAGFLRRELGHRVDLRYTPELIFELDTNMEYASRMTKLIDEAVKRDASKPSESEE